MIGLLPIDKPAGMTSFDVIRQVRRITGLRKWGHLGTLDPFATGLLPLMADKTTRLAACMNDRVKTYEATMRLGVRTDTGDSTGKVTDVMTAPTVDIEELNGLIDDIRNINEQIPPIFSAVKVDGQPAYRKAHKGDVPILKPRPIIIYRVNFLEVNDDLIRYRAVVSKGTYIRVLSESIAELLGSLATTVELRRLEIGGLSVERAVKLDDLVPDSWANALISPEALMDNIPRYVLREADEAVFARGMRCAAEVEDTPTVLVVNEQDEILGVGEICDGQLQPHTVLI